MGGLVPADDLEARTRVVDAARVIVRATGAAPTVADVADALSVTRQTLYRYFTSAEVLLLAAASDGLASLLDEIVERMATSDDPAEVVVEAIALTIEEIERRSEVALVPAPARGFGSREVTSAVVVELGRNLLQGSGVDWPAAGSESGARLEELVRHMHAAVVCDRPGFVPAAGEDLRAYLRAVGRSHRRPWWRQSLMDTCTDEFLRLTARLWGASSALTAGRSRFTTRSGSTTGPCR
jgi:AcrR family transcriptional regulator